MVCPALVPITRALLPLSDRLSPKTTSELYMLAEAGGAVNETTATAIKGKNLLNAYFMKLPTLLLNCSALHRVARSVSTPQSYVAVRSFCGTALVWVASPLLTFP